MVSLNIKSGEADRLVEELSKLTGESKTQAVIAALRERLERERRSRSRKALALDLLAIGRKCAGYGRRDATEHGALLYDERGLPR
jgi:antitoxin VapB